MLQVDLLIVLQVGRDRGGEERRKKEEVVMINGRKEEALMVGKNIETIVGGEKKKNVERKKGKGAKQICGLHLTVGGKTSAGMKIGDKNTKTDNKKDNETDGCWVM